MRYIPWYIYFLLHPAPPHITLTSDWDGDDVCGQQEHSGARDQDDSAFGGAIISFPPQTPSSSFWFYFLVLFVLRLYNVILSNYLSCAAMDLTISYCHSFLWLLHNQHCARQCKPKHPFLTNKQCIHPNITHPGQCDRQFIFLIQTATSKSLVKKIDSKRLGQHWEIFTTEPASQHWVGERRIAAISADPSCASFSATTFAQIQSHTFAHKCGLILLVWPGSCDLSSWDIDSKTLIFNAIIVNRQWSEIEWIL